MLSKPKNSERKASKRSASRSHSTSGLSDAYYYDSSNQSIPLAYQYEDFIEFVIDEVGNEAQGRSRVSYERRKKLHKQYAQLPEGVVWEFGKQIDLGVESDVSDYLHHLDVWLKNLKKPKTLGSCQAKVETFLKAPHRHIGLLLLAQAGNRMAMLFLAVRRGMEQEQYNDFSLAEAQFFGVGEMLLLATLFVMISGSYLARNRIMEKVRSVVDLTNAVDDLAQTLTRTANNVTEYCEKIKQWIQRQFDKLLEIFKNMSRWVLPIAKMILFFTVIIMAAKAAMTLAEFVYDQILDVIVTSFSLPERVRGWLGRQAQAGKSKGFLPEMLGSVYEYLFNDTSDVFFEYLGPLPKVVSIAKAIEWIYEKFSKVLRCAMEAYTGELQGSSAQEMAISDFKQQVQDYEYKVENATTMELNGVDLAQMDSQLSSTKSILAVRVVTNIKMRPAFVSLFNQASASLSVAQAMYRRKLGQGHKRPIPVWLFIHGEPGIGKSQSVEGLCSMIWMYLNKYSPGMLPTEKYDCNQLFAFNQEDEYYDGYLGQPIVQIDDFFQMKSPELRAHTSGVLINMISPTPYSLLVATPSMKAHTYFTSRLIISTSNIKPDLKGEATGLADYTALRDRITLGVEKLEGDRFAISLGEVSTATKPNGRDTRPILTAIQLAQVIGEAIIDRENEKMAEEDYQVPERFVGNMKSARFSMEHALVIMDDEKGKEKVRDDVVAQGLGTNFRRCASNLHDRVAYVLNGLPARSRAVVEDYLPEYFLPIPTVEMGKVETYEHWAHNRLCVYYAMTHGGSVPTKEQYQRMLASPPKGSFYTLFFAGCAGVGLAALAAWKLIQLVMPGGAHERVAVQSKRYDSQAPGRSRPGKEERGGVIRAGQGQRGFRRDYNASFWNQTQGGESTVRTLVNENTVAVEMRRGDLGQKWAEVKDTSVECATWGLFVASDYLMIPNHLLFAKADLESNEIFLTLQRGENLTLNLRDVKEYHELDGDIAIIKVPGVRLRRNILGHFANEVPRSGRIEHLLAEVPKNIIVAEVAAMWENKISYVPVNTDYGTIETDLRLYGVKNEVGMCGSVYVHQGTGKIVAVHMGGNPSSETAYATLILKQDLERIVKPIEIIPPFEPALEETTIQSGIQTVGLLSRKMGTFIPGDTKLRPTLFDLDGLPFPKTTDKPAKLKRFTHDGVVVDPINNHFVNKLAHVEAYPWISPLDSFKGFLPRTFDASRVRVITIEEAIYGIPGELKPMDRNTSVGYFYKKMGLKREKLFGPPRNEDGTYGPTRMKEAYIHPLLRRDVEHKMKIFRDTGVIPVVFEMFMKDELRPVEKVDAGNTRAIDPMDLASLVVQRMVLGTLIEESMKDPVNCPIALGINPHSSQWGMLYARHRGDGTRKVGAGDFQGFDINIPNEIRDDFIRFVRQVHPDPDLAERVIMANFVGWHICGRLLFYRYMGNSSGSLITAFFNCFANWWIHKQAWLTKYKEEDFHHLELSFVGDDSVFSTPHKFQEYNMELISAFCRDVLHMTYTSPTKDQNMHCSWEDLIFLKRRFVPSPIGVMGPLAPGSLSNMVAWCECDPRDSVTMESTLRSLMVESFHYGRDTYRVVENWARRESRKLGFLCDIPDWTAMYNSRKKDYVLGAGCGACVRGERETSFWMKVNVMLGIASIKLLPTRWAIGVVNPIIEELARTFSPEFSQELISLESSSTELYLSFLPDEERDVGASMRGLTNKFHELACSLAHQRPWTSLFERIDMHVKLNLRAIDYTPTRSSLRKHGALIKGFYDKY